MTFDVVHNIETTIMIEKIYRPNSSSYLVQLSQYYFLPISLIKNIHGTFIKYTINYKTKASNHN